ncbi:MAG: hypothetical protein WC061_07895 [Melioribacteraceae bacterium]
MKPFFIPAILILLLFFSSAAAQCDTLNFPLLVITLTDKTEYAGRIESSESKFLNFITRENQKIKILKSRIKDVVSYEDSDLARREKEAIRMKTEKRDTVLLPEYTDAGLNRMIIFPTARPLKPWQGYVQLNELFFPFAAVGIGTFLTVGGGISILPSLQKQLVYLSPKITPLHSDNLALAAGVFYMTSTDFNRAGFNDGVGILYSMTTLGDKEKNISVGLGWGFSGEHYSDKPVLILGGDIKIGRSLKLIAETWTPIGSKFMLGMIGFRVIGKHITGDAALISAFAPDSNAGLIPWFSLTYNFGYE